MWKHIKCFNVKQAVAEKEQTCSVNPLRVSGSNVSLRGAMMNRTSDRFFLFSSQTRTLVWQRPRMRLQQLRDRRARPELLTVITYVSIIVIVVAVRPSRGVSAVSGWARKGHKSQRHWHQTEEVDMRRL